MGGWGTERAGDSSTALKGGIRQPSKFKSKIIKILSDFFLKKKSTFDKGTFVCEMMRAEPPKARVPGPPKA